jgi:hypothetical protein
VSPVRVRPGVLLFHPIRNNKINNLREILVCFLFCLVLLVFA